MFVCILITRVMFVCLSNAFAKDAKNRTRDQFHMRIRMELEGIIFCTHTQTCIYKHTYINISIYVCITLQCMPLICTLM